MALQRVAHRSRAVNPDTAIRIIPHVLGKVAQSIDAIRERFAAPAAAPAPVPVQAVAPPAAAAAAPAPAPASATFQPQPFLKLPGFRQLRESITSAAAPAAPVAQPTEVPAPRRSRQAARKNGKPSVFKLQTRSIFIKNLPRTAVSSLVTTYNAPAFARIITQNATAKLTGPQVTLMIAVFPGGIQQLIPLAVARKFYLSALRGKVSHYTPAESMSFMVSGIPNTSNPLAPVIPGSGRKRGHRIRNNYENDHAIDIASIADIIRNCLNNMPIPFDITNDNHKSIFRNICHLINSEGVVRRLPYEINMFLKVFEEWYRNDPNKRYLNDALDYYYKNIYTRPGVVRSFEMDDQLLKFLVESSRIGYSN